MKKILAVIAGVAFVATPLVGWAHPGNTASDGCHYCRTNCTKWGVAWNERHCHGGGSYSPPRTSTPARSPVNTASTLKRGTSSSEVTRLQTILAKDLAIYPEGLITGYFGPATERAIKLYQKKYGLEQVGYVGPKTRALLKLEGL
ncbi:MAG: 50S ribosomal protein L5 [Candidatus Giovannonibacteria bacterium GW2011_GWA2_45_21]|uniref:50S ribosomal protein L5 n=1 Tax=Candidatus Giovannonibacteria bacterium GW2011_GWA2_45_21 TaxID=1618649 RepID=A0A0G1MB04_9BACT|nr:MAG: 50S ribosomal protein L5 [Candidatus Giovannonibacteria bacterium GW2011_GWA2_45_21]